MNIAIKKFDNTKSFDTYGKAQPEQASKIGNELTRTPTKDFFCRNNNSVSFQGRAKELGDVLSILEKFLEKDEALIAKTKCKIHTPEGKAKNIAIFITHRIFRTGYGRPDQEFYRLLNSEGHELGKMTIFCKIKENTKYGTKTDEPITSGHLYLSGLETVGALEPETQKSERKYSGLGTILEKIAVLRSIEKGLEGRVRLEATFGSHCFHYKNGFRISEEHPKILDEKEIEKEIEGLIKKSEISRRIPNTKEIKSVLMYLPKKNREILLNKGEKIELL